MLQFTDDEVFNLLNSLNIAQTYLEKSIEISDPANPLYQPDAAVHLQQLKRTIKKVDDYLAQEFKDAQ